MNLKCFISRADLQDLTSISAYPLREIDARLCLLTHGTITANNVICLPWPLQLLEKFSFANLTTKMK
jgi:hypothetical protein